MKGAAWLVVFATSLISGGWSIPTGFALGLAPIETYVAACLGSMTGLALFLIAGDRARSWITRRRQLPEVDPDSWLGRILERHGVQGLGLVGPIFPGVTASALIGIALDLPRRPLAVWMTLGTAVLFALYVGGLWLLIDLIGLD